MLWQIKLLLEHHIPCPIGMLLLSNAAEEGRSLEQEGEVSHPLVHFSNVCSSQSWDDPKPKARSFLCFSCVGAGTQELGNKAGREWASQHSTSVLMGCWRCTAFNHYATVLAPINLFFLKEKKCGIDKLGYRTTVKIGAGSTQ